MIDISDASQAYQRTNVTKIGWIRRDSNIAYSLTNFEPGERLLHFMSNGMLEYVVEKMSVREATEPAES